MTTLNLDDIRALCEAAKEFRAGTKPALIERIRFQEMTAALSQMLAEIERLRGLLATSEEQQDALYETLQTLRTDAELRHEQLRDDLARITPVYSAAVAWRDWSIVEGRVHIGAHKVLADAIDTAEYQASAERREQDGER